MGFVTSDPGDGRQRPAVLFLHGGYAFGEGHWDMARPYADAGFVVMIPVLRGENGQGGDFSLFFDEVDDVLAASDALARLPYVDNDRLFVAGHSVGGTLTMLAAMVSPRFKAAASFSGSPDQRIYTRGRKELIPFDPYQVEEWQVRSPVVYPASFRCPTRLYHGDEEFWLGGPTIRLGALAKKAGRDVEVVEIVGDHTTSIPEAIGRSIRFFRDQ